MFEFNNYFKGVIMADKSEELNETIKKMIKESFVSNKNIEPKHDEIIGNDGVDRSDLLKKEDRNKDCS